MLVVVPQSGVKCFLLCVRDPGKGEALGSQKRNTLYSSVGGERVAMRNVEEEAQGSWHKRLADGRQIRTNKGGRDGQDK